MRSMVEGPSRALTQNELVNPLQIPHHLLGRNPDRPDPSSQHPRIPPLVPLRIVAHPMNCAVDLDAKLQGRCVEIQGIGPDRMLVAEFDAQGLAAKDRP